MNLKETLFFLEKENTNRFYTFLFREELYVITNKYNKSLNPYLSESKKYISERKINYLNIKQNIKKLQYPFLFQKNNKVFYKLDRINTYYLSNEHLYTLIELIFIIFFDLYMSKSRKSSIQAAKFYLEKNNKLNKNNSLSIFHQMLINTNIHWGFLFLEHRSVNYDCIIKAHIKKYIHSEVVIRIMRKYVRDVSIIQIVRYLFVLVQKNRKIYNQNIFRYYLKIIKNKINNIIALEIDYFIFNNFFNLQYLINKENSKQDQIINIHKWNKEEFKNVDFPIFNGQNLQLNPNKKDSLSIYLVNYLRYESSFLLIFEGSNPLSILIYKSLNRFCKRRMNISIIYTDFYSNNSFYHYFNYLNFVINNNIKIIKIEIIGYFSFSLISYQIQSPYIFIHLHFLIKVLYSFELCSRNGYPITKLSWTSLDDLKILSQFQKIYEYLLFFYSGIINYSTLSHLYHMMNDSCLKTIASKHKTNIKSIIHHYRIENQWTEKKKNRHLINPLDFIIKIRVWHIDLINKQIINYY